MQIKGNFTQNFIGDIENDTRKEGKKPTNIADAIRDLRDTNFPMWDEMARSVFYKPGDELTIEEVMENIEKTDTCDGAEIPVGVYIDPAGEFQIEVFDDPENEFETVCSYCGKIIRAGKRKTSHGICSNCLEEKIGKGNDRNIREENPFGKSEEDLVYNGKQCHQCGKYYPDHTVFVNNECWICRLKRKIDAPWDIFDDVVFLAFYLSKDEFDRKEAIRFAKYKGINCCGIIETKTHFVFPQEKYTPASEIRAKKYEVSHGVLVSYAKNLDSNLHGIE